MSQTNEKIECRTPTSGKKSTRIDAWKFDAVRKAILKVVPKRGDGVAFSDLPDLVKKQLPAQQSKDLGSLMWYVTTVKLELEVRGEIARVARAAPQRLVRI